MYISKDNLYYLCIYLFNIPFYEIEYWVMPTVFMALKIDGKLEVDAHVRRTQYVYRSCRFNIVSWHVALKPGVDNLNLI